MVWGMRMASGFGDYFLHGEYVGHDEALAAYYTNEMSDAEKSEMQMEDGISYTQFSAKFIRDKGTLKPHEWPVEFNTAKTYKNVASLTMLNFGLLAVDEELKSIIERLEPDVHQFSPIKITMPKGKEYPKQYYAMVVSTFHDSFSPEMSEEGSYRAKIKPSYTKYRVDLPKKEKFAGLAMHENVYGKSHLWRERKLDDPDLYISDELHTEIVSHVLRVPQMYQLKGV